MQFGIQALGAMLVTTVVTALRYRWARRRRAEVVAGATAVVTAALTRDDGRARPGRLILAPGSASWHARRGGDRVDLATAVVLHTWVATDWRAHPGNVIVRLALPTGGTVEVQLFGADAATLAEILEMPPLAGSGPHWPRVSGWAIASVALGLAVIGLFVAMAASAVAVTATVTGGDGNGVCDVTWTASDGGAGHGAVDCADDPPGSVRTVWVLSDDVLDPARFTGGMLGVGLLVAAPGVVRVLVVGHRRRLLSAAHAGASHDLVNASTRR